MVDQAPKLFTHNEEAEFDKNVLVRVPPSSVFAVNLLTTTTTTTTAIPGSETASCPEIISPGDGLTFLRSCNAALSCLAPSSIPPNP